MMQKFKILVTRKWPKKVEESLVTTFDTTLNVEDKPLSESELIEAMKSYDALLPTVTDPITDKIISTPDRQVKIIGNFGVGFNNIDIDSAKKQQYSCNKYSRSLNRLYSRYCYVTSTWCGKKRI